MAFEKANGLAILFYCLFLVASSGEEEFQEEFQSPVWSGYYQDNGTHYILYEKSKATRPSYLIRNISTNPAINAIESLDFLPTRIVNGQKISIQQAPYQCALHYQNSFICGCVIINRYWILTAQHCKIGGPGSYTVRAGSTQQRRGGELRHVQKIVSHGGYSERTMKNDLVMMKLKQPLKFRKGVQPVKLPSPKIKTFPRCYWASGWGLTSANAQNVQKNLRRARVCMVGRSRCRAMYRKAGIKIYRVMICAKGKNRDTCSGDSGGPLVHNGVLYGITSFGIGCANANYPGVYVNIKTKVRWIKKVVRKY